MDEIHFIMPNETLAYKGQQLLAAQRIQSSVVRNRATTVAGGCSFSLRLRAKDRERAVRMLAAAGLPTGQTGRGVGG